MELCRAPQPPSHLQPAAARRCPRDGNINSKKSQPQPHRQPSMDRGPWPSMDGKSKSGCIGFVGVVLAAAIRFVRLVEACCRRRLLSRTCDVCAKNYCVPDITNAVESNSHRKKRPAPLNCDGVRRPRWERQPAATTVSFGFFLQGGLDIQCWTDLIPSYQPRARLKSIRSTNSPNIEVVLAAAAAASRTS